MLVRRIVGQDAHVIEVGEKRTERIIGAERGVRPREARPTSIAPSVDFHAPVSP